MKQIYLIIRASSFIIYHGMKLQVVLVLNVKRPHRQVMEMFCQINNSLVMSKLYLYLYSESAV